MNTLLRLLETLWPWLLAVAGLGVAVAATMHIVLRKRDSRSAIAWVGLVWLAPWVGSLLYYMLGINRIQRKAVSLGIQQPTQAKLTPGQRVSPEHCPPPLRARHPHLSGLAEAGSRLTGSPLLPGNHVHTLLNGDQAYPDMLSAIDAAAHSVSLASYIFDSDRAGDAFMEALLRAQDRGVEVRVLIDAVGAGYSQPEMPQRLADRGIRTGVFLPTRLARLSPYANLRNHRKILVVDGRIGYTGGTNIREGHWLSLNPADPVQCLHFRFQGPVVAYLQQAFAADWGFVTHELLDGAKWFPPLEHEGAVWARAIASGPDEDLGKMQDTLLAAVSVAQTSIRIVTPYFLPTDELSRALGVAALRGVDTHIYLPEKSNISLVQWASSAMYWQVLAKGCRIFLTPQPFDHTKLFLVDGIWSLVGSTNWDPRSLRLNFELNVECYDATLGAALERLVSVKAGRAHEITLADMDGRSLPKQLRDGIARLMTPYL